MGTPMNGIRSNVAPNGYPNGGGDVEAPADYFDGVHEYIRRMLMEEDELDHRPCMFQDCSALQAAEKYFRDALTDTPPDDSLKSSGFHLWSTFDCNFYGDSGPSFSCEFDRLVASPQTTPFHLLNSTPTTTYDQQILPPNYNSATDDLVAAAGDERRREGRERDGGDGEEELSSKHLAVCCGEERVDMHKYDKSLLCPKMNPGFYDPTPTLDPPDETSDSAEESKKEYRKTREVKRGRPKGSKKNRKVNQVVDLSSLLTRCAEAVSTFNTKTAQDLLKQIRSHCSPYGDANQRLAHCFANALEARMAGTGSALYASVASRRIPASELLKSYQAYVTVCPFKRMSNIFANKSIASHTIEASKIHIIDFGILYGFQWPCIIQGLSLKPGGPPRLKITGIDYPQPGFRPAERIEQTGRRLQEYCKRFHVPFEYNALAKRWEDIKAEDLKIEGDEMVVVNCVCRLLHAADESAGVNSPRNAVLKTIRDLKPQLFVHGVVNGTYNASFFATRFKEVLFHYSSQFDMMEALLPREDEDRLLYEREVFGRDVMNVIACEGGERVERPESYKQWQVRNQRAGFEKVPLSGVLVDELKVKVRRDYHRDFMVEVDNGWVLQGWKGRVMYALSCWKLSR